MKNAVTFISAVLAVLSISACVPVVAAGAGAEVGVGAASEGGIKGDFTDKAIYIRITDLWTKSSLKMYSGLTLDVTEGRVLVAGTVPNADMRVEAVRLAWQVGGVRQVINEIRVEDGGGVGGYMTDTWVSGNIKTRMLLDKYVQSINYNIDCVNGTVYIMGVAEDQKEMDTVLDIARNTKYVKNVVSYARLRGETPQGLLPPTNGETEKPLAPHG